MTKRSGGFGQNITRSRATTEMPFKCAGICRLIREESRLVISIRSVGSLQRVLDGCGISKAQFDDVEKGSFKVRVSAGRQRRPT